MFSQPVMSPSVGCRFLRYAPVIIALLTVVPLHGQNFNRDIRPILSDRCFVCHGPDASSNDSGLRLDIADQAYDRSAFLAGNLDDSEAIQRILSNDPDQKMPPVGSHLEVSEAEIELLKSWVKAGAKYDQHWAFKPLPRFIMTPQFSRVRPWIYNNIDVYVLRELESRRLSPSPPADRWRWLRRVTYDLTGLPPTKEQIDSFLSDDSDEAFEKVVDRLLASEEFGKHMAVSWLDVARYADSYGYQSDQLSTNWPYRDWVVNAINENLGYDDFLRWQIAGDLLENATSDQVLATAFNRLHRMTNEGGSVELEWRTEYVADRVNTFGTAMLGLTLECARCHDHKFDPISQQDYYNLSAFFNNIDEWGMYHDAGRTPTPSLMLPNDQQALTIEKARKDRESAEQELEKWTSDTRQGFGAWLQENQTLNIDLSVVSVHESVERQKHGRIALWTLDERNSENQFANDVDTGQPAVTSNANQLVEGVRGNALQLSGDDGLQMPIQGEWLEPWKPFSISLWVKIPEDLNEAVIFHRQGGTDVGTFGTRLALFDGQLRLEMTRFWPGNAIAVQSTTALPSGEWIHLVASNRGGGHAKDLRIHVNGKCVSQPIRDGLAKDPQFRPGNQTGFVIGEQFRRVGFKGGLVDEVAFFTFALTDIEVAALLNDQNELAANSFTDEQLVEHFLETEKADRRSQVNQVTRQSLLATVGVTEISVMQEMDEQRKTYVLQRGEYDAERSDQNIATPLTPKELPRLAKKDNLNRHDLADWLLQDSHPLTARVAVNRFWQGFFGQGLIATPNDLGYQSELPLYAELLDWLARDFVSHDWDVKRLCKQIVLSNTYRQDSRCDKELRNRDPENQWLARGPANRLTAEMVRDSALFVSGLLDPVSKGPAVSPYQPENLWRENNTMTPAYRQSVGTALYRRSLFTVWKRTTPMPNMMSFDAPSREVCVVQRAKTNTPQQAMVLLNDVQFVEAARMMAQKVLGDASVTSDQEIIDWLFVRLAGRTTTQPEFKVLEELLKQQRVLFADEPDNAKKLTSLGESAAPDPEDVVEVAAITVVAQAIFNIDATIWKR